MGNKETKGEKFTHKNKNFQYVQELNSAYLKGRLVVFYGAGLSMPLGLQGWDQLITYVIERLIADPCKRRRCIDKTSKVDFWEAMEYVKDFAQVSERKIQELIAECIKCNENNNEDDICTIDNNYSDLLDFQVPFFITTNYDTFFQKFGNQFEAFDINRAIELPFAELFGQEKKQRKIIYLHGHVNNITSIVITKDGVEEIYNSEKWTDIFKNFLNNYYILFIGVSFEDRYLKQFLTKIVKNNNNDYYVITNRVVDFPCKSIIIPKNYEERVVNIRKILDKVKQHPEETIWVRLCTEYLTMDNLKHAIEKKLTNIKDINYKIFLCENEEYIIISIIHMKKSKSISDAIQPYEALFGNTTISRFRKNNNIVYFYSQNKNNFNESYFKRIFENNMKWLFKYQMMRESKGFIIDRLQLCTNDSDKIILNAYQVIRCNLENSEINLRNNESKEYIFYIDENISIKNAKSYGVEVHVSGFCFFANKLLMEDRTMNSAIASGMIAPVGGRMRVEESFEQALQRHFIEDCNLVVNNIKVYNVFSAYNTNVPGLAFVCNIKEIFKKNKAVSSNISLYTKEELIECSKLEKLACEEKLLLEAFNLNQKIRKKSIKIRLVLWTNCCYQCIGCHHENLKNISMPHDSNAILKSLKILGEVFDIRQITITGGEPLLDIKQLDDILKKICIYFPFSDLAIITNGEKLNENVIDEFSKYNVRYKISLYGYDNNSFQKYTKYNGYIGRDYLKTIQEKMQILIDKNIDFTVNIPVHKFIINGIRNLYNDLLVYLLKQNTMIKFIDMVKPRTESNFFADIYTPLGEAKKQLLDFEDRIYKHMVFFKYPCKSCNKYNEECLENFALTLEPNGTLLVCDNAIAEQKIAKKDFVSYLSEKGITVETTKYNVDYGKF